jgi:3-oxoacyl-[acyl-carrier protein] reductase
VLAKSSTAPTAATGTGRFENKVVVVTGAAAGIGRTYAQRFCDEGAFVFVADSDARAARATAKRLSVGGARAEAVVVDVADEVGVSAMAELIGERHGRIDVLVNNAGIHVHHARAPFTAAALGQWRRILDVNVLGPLSCAVACRELLAASGNGVVLNQSSAAAYRGGSAYAVSKAALNALTAALAAELAADGCRVVGVAPGLVDSRAALDSLGERGIERNLSEQLIKRVGRMHDLADVVLFLCSDAASFVTATTVVVDGGLTRRPT